MSDKALIEAAIAVVDGWSKQRFDSRSALMCQCIDALHRAAIAAAQAEPSPMPDMRHPKIQALIGAKARREIELRLAEDLLDDPKYEIWGTDGDYWYSLHDKIVELQHRAQAEQSASAEDARRIAILSAALHLVRSMPDWDARPDGSLEPFAEMMDMALRGEVHDILSFIEYVHATYPVADGAAMKGQP